MCAKITISALWLLRTTHYMYFIQERACYLSHGVTGAASTDKVNQPVNVI